MQPDQRRTLSRCGKHVGHFGDMNDEERPMVAVSAVQYFMKSLRETPFAFSLS
jgi:hypothetical protein